MSTTDECQICHGSTWVCEIHPDKAWSGASLHPDSCPNRCIGPGMPCQCSHLHASRLLYRKPQYRHLAESATDPAEAALAGEVADALDRSPLAAGIRRMGKNP